MNYDLLRKNNSYQVIKKLTFQKYFVFRIGNKRFDNEYNYKLIHISPYK